MDKKVTGIVSYITIIGWIIAFLAGDKEGAKFHLNQSLVLFIIQLAYNLILSGIIGKIPLLGGLVNFVVGIFFIVCWILGLVYAIKEENKEIPLIGAIKILK